MKALFPALISGPNGEPDECALAFIFACLLLWGGTIFNIVVAHRFAGMDFVSQQITLTAVYTTFVTARKRLQSS